jgi:hypothetical protein
MTRRLACIVEGDGEVQALPVLIRRIAEWQATGRSLVVDRPIRVRRDRFLRREDEFRRTLLLAQAKASTDGAILLLLDADDDCPAVDAPALQARCAQHVPGARLQVVFAMHEFESWFLAAAASLDGVRGFQAPEGPVVDPEGPRDAKGWVSRHIGQGGYSPVHDQAAFTARLDLDAAYSASRSFRRLVSAWRNLMA